MKFDRDSAQWSKSDQVQRYEANSLSTLTRKPFNIGGDVVLKPNYQRLQTCTVSNYNAICMGKE